MSALVRHGWYENVQCGGQQGPEKFVYIYGRMFPLLNIPGFWCMSRSRFIIRMAIRPPVDPFRIYKIGPWHFPPFKRPFQEGPGQEGHIRLIKKEYYLLSSWTPPKMEYF